ncbi:MAG: HDOD domain-containing protein [Proteobacteria bacterium]|nr:HDOD domain-containing protein [Pseudomonadota bacterium]
MDAFIARQPIFNEKKQLFAYELLFRDGLSNFMPDIEGDVATSKLLSSTYFTIGIDKITNGKRAFINFTENLLVDEFPLLFPKETTVIEILEDVNPNENVIRVSQKFSANGYLLALDDFVFHPDLKPLIALADIIKIDFRQTPPDEIERYISEGHLQGAKLLAEKVETYEEFNLALELGFEYYQGYFFSKPEIIKGSDISSSQFRLLEIVASVNKPDFEFDTVEKLVQSDLSISYKLLRCINSVFFKRKGEITSIRQALVYLGQNEIRRFVSLIALSSVTTVKPTELIRSCCIRARFCELLSSVSECAEPADELFTIGLFSNIDAVLDQPMADIMAKLPLSPKIVSTLTKGRNELSKYLSLSKCYEIGDWQSVRNLAAELCIAEENIPPIYLKACEWANAIAASH